MIPGICTFTYLSNNLLISSWILAKFVSALLPCMLYLSHYFQPDVQTLRRAITLQVDSCHNLNLQMIFRHTIYIDVSFFSKNLKNCGLEVFKIKLQSLIYNIMCYIHIINLSKYMMSCCLLVITSDYIATYCIYNAVSDWPHRRIFYIQDVFV